MPPKRRIRKEHALFTETATRSQAIAKEQDAAEKVHPQASEVEPPRIHLQATSPGTVRHKSGSQGGGGLTAKVAGKWQAVISRSVGESL